VQKLRGKGWRGEQNGGVGNKMVGWGTKWWGGEQKGGGGEEMGAETGLAGWGGHGEDFNPRPVSNIDNYFTTTGLNDIVFNILLPSNPGRLHGAMHLRQRGHNFVLPNIKYDFNKRHFIARSLFCYI